jgi:uncharacterized protein (TIGR02646 family)
MIRIDRTSVGKPSVLDSKKANSERSRATDFYTALAAQLAAAAGSAASPTAAAPGKPKRRGGKRNAKANAKGKNGKKGPKKGKEKKEKKKKFPFEVYKDKEVKALLHSLFHGKCAYCEARYIATQPMDVEHFRPKSEVTDFDGSKGVGYYWLAAEWTNLLPSCIDCNRPRNHLDNNGQPVRLGKDTLFPLAPNSPRAAAGGSIDNERPLLLDPCRDRPEQYLVYTEAVIAPASGPTAPADAVDRVAASLRVYGLNRTDLVQERRQVLLNLRMHFHQFRKLTEALETAKTIQPANVRELLEQSLGDLLSHETDAILRMSKTSESFSLMVNQEIATFEAEIGRGFR